MCGGGWARVTIGVSKVPTPRVRGWGLGVGVLLLRALGAT